LIETLTISIRRGALQHAFSGVWRFLISYRNTFLLIIATFGTRTIVNDRQRTTGDYWRFNLSRDLPCGLQEESTCSMRCISDALHCLLPTRRWTFGTRLRSCQLIVLFIYTVLWGGGFGGGFTSGIPTAAGGR